MPLGEEAVMADAVEAIGQGVEKEFSDLGTSMPRPVQCNKEENQSWQNRKMNKNDPASIA